MRQTLYAERLIHPPGLSGFVPLTLFSAVGYTFFNRRKIRALLRMNLERYMKKTLLVIFISLTFVWQASAKTQDLDFDQAIQKSDIIVEGTVQQVDISGEKIPLHIGQSGVFMPVAFGYQQESLIRVMETYKGNILRYSLISVYSSPGDNQLIQIQPDKKYVFFLKQHENGQGYTIIDKGKGHWLVFDYNGAMKIKAWYQDSSLRQAQDYYDYDIFIGALKHSITPAVAAVLDIKNQ